MKDKSPKYILSTILLQLSFIFALEQNTTLDRDSPVLEPQTFSQSDRINCAILGFIILFIIIYIYEFSKIECIKRAMRKEERMEEEKMEMMREENNSSSS